MSDFLAEYGDVVVSSRIIADENVAIIKITPGLDLALGGGIPEGSFVTLTGAPKSGKTTCALHIAAKAQTVPLVIKDKTFERHVYYVNVEGRVKPRDLRGIHNLDLDKCTVIRSQLGNILTADQFLTIAERIINEKPGSVIIIDSYSALCTANEMTTDMDKLQRAEGAKLLAKFMRKVSNVVPINKNIVIGITHQMANITGYGSPILEKSGFAVAYQTDVKLRATKFTPIIINNNQIGQETIWKVITSALGGPGSTPSTYLRYGYGLDEVMELIKLGVDLSIIKKRGAWLAYGENKLQGQEGARKFFLDDDQRKLLCKDISAIIGYDVL